MTTFEAATAGFLLRASERVRERAVRRSQRESRVKVAGVSRFARPLLTLVALGSFTAAASTVGLWCALLVGGACALYLAQAVDG